MRQPSRRSTTTTCGGLRVVSAWIGSLRAWGTSRKSYYATSCVAGRVGRSIPRGPRDYVYPLSTRIRAFSKLEAGWGPMGCLERAWARWLSSLCARGSWDDAPGCSCSGFGEDERSGAAQRSEHLGSRSEFVSGSVVVELCCGRRSAPHQPPHSSACMREREGDFWEEKLEG